MASKHPPGFPVSLVEIEVDPPQIAAFLFGIHCAFILSDKQQAPFLSPREREAISDAHKILAERGWENKSWLQDAERAIKRILDKISPTERN